MRHGVRKKTLNRTSAHRKSMIRNLSDSLIEHERIETTLTKAKFFKPYVEKLITKARDTNKEDKVAVFNTVKYLRTKLHSEDMVRKLVEEIGPRFTKRKGGYVRIVRVGNRAGDNAMMARVELTETSKKKIEVKDKEALKRKTSPKKKSETKVEEVKEMKEVKETKVEEVLSEEKETKSEE